MIEQFALIIIGLAMGGAAAWFFFRRAPTQPHDAVHQQMMSWQHFMGEQIERLNQQIDRRLQENARAVNESKEFLANRVSAAERSVRFVGAGLGKLEQATNALQRTSDEISSFQKMLRSPKVRGSFGEVMLGNLLSEVLPQDRFEQQYLFQSTGEITDAIIRLRDGYIVAIDAKFPLANYQALVQEQNDEAKQTLRKEFMRDVKKHVADIAKKYISPQDKTLDYAFMYIPSEGVYYETIVHEPNSSSLWEYCLSHKVIPVSPNSFLAYLQTVLIGLRGMKIEQQAREILQHLGQLRRDFGSFAKDFTMMGAHLTNAKNRFEDSARRLDKFTNRLDQIEGGPQSPQLKEKSVEAVEYKQKVIETERVQQRE